MGTTHPLHGLAAVHALDHVIPCCAMKSKNLQTVLMAVDDGVPLRSHAIRTHLASDWTQCKARSAKTHRNLTITEVGNIFEFASASIPGSPTDL